MCVFALACFLGFLLTYLFVNDYRPDPLDLIIVEKEDGAASPSETTPLTAKLTDNNIIDAKREEEDSTSSSDSDEDRQITEHVKEL